GCFRVVLIEVLLDLFEVHTIGSFFGTYVFFFFQAEDGIRDATVTGVQTCALPIFSSYRAGETATSNGRASQPGAEPSGSARQSRSEERRVGKECRTGWSTQDKKKKNRKAIDICSMERIDEQLEVETRTIVNYTFYT